MKLVSVDEMRQLDTIAQDEYGIDGYTLMAEAGRSIAEHVYRTYHPDSVCIVAGKGNNAGDGFVAAREFHVWGRDVTVVCLEEPDAYKGAAKTAWDKLAGTKVKVANAAGLGEAISKCDVVIDALLGTGIKGAVRGRYADVIRQLNESGAVIISADVPSGLRELAADEDPGDIIRADMTLTVGLPKTILLTLPGSVYTGRLTVLSINFPKDLLESDRWQLNWASGPEMKGWLPERAPDSNKGTYGHVGIIGSALSYAGATVLTARAALRAGCGLATIYTLPDANPIYKTALPEATSVIIESQDGHYFDTTSAESFEQQCKAHTVLAVGPGLGTAPETRQFLQRVLKHWTGPLVLDADGLNITADGMLDLLDGREDCLITPHPGEMSRLTGLSVAEIQADRVGAARAFAADHNLTVLLKGTGTIVARPDGQAWLVPGAEPALAKGGTGDVLTGAIAALFAQGVPMDKAAIVGACAHLAAGQRAASHYGTRGLLASEVADAIPMVLDLITGDIVD